MSVSSWRVKYFWRDQPFVNPLPHIWGPATCVKSTLAKELCKRISEVGSYLLPGRLYWSPCDGITILLGTLKWQEETWCLSLFKYGCCYLTKDQLAARVPQKSGKTASELSEVTLDQTMTVLPRGGGGSSQHLEKLPSNQNLPEIDYNLTFPQQIIEIYSE